MEWWRLSGTNDPETLAISGRSPAGSTTIGCYLLTTNHQGMAMTRLAEAIEALDLEGELSLSGSWVRLRGEQCTVYVVEAVSGTRYYTWCDAPHERYVELFHDPIEAIQAGLRRAAGADG